MSDTKKETQLLIEIKEILKEINSRQQVKEIMAETDKLIKKSESRVEYALNQIQNSFDRIHDKLFNFNNIMIAAYFVLGTFPSESPIISLWTSILPILNLIFLIFIEIRQMEIHRFASRQMEWDDVEREKYGKKNLTQTQLSLLSIVVTIGIFFFLATSVFLN